MSEAIYGPIADQYAKQYGINPDLYRRIIKQESGWKANAQSPVGAYGLTQVMPTTAKDPGFGVGALTNRDDTNEQLRFGAQYFGKMLERYDGDTNKALAAYNWGAGNADGWDGQNMAALPDETRGYVTNINGPGGGNGGGLQAVSFSSKSVGEGALSSGGEEEKIPNSADSGTINRGNGYVDPSFMAPATISGPAPLPTAPEGNPKAVDRRGRPVKPAQPMTLPQMGAAVADTLGLSGPATPRSASGRNPEVTPTAPTAPSGPQRMSNGQLPDDFLTTNAMAAINRAEGTTIAQPGDPNVPVPNNQAPQAAEAVSSSSPALMSQPVDPQTEAIQTEVAQAAAQDVQTGTDPSDPSSELSKYQQFMTKLLPGMSEGQRNDRLLAIGAGLLSGDNWQSGFAGASANLFGLSGQEKEMGLAQQKIDADFAAANSPAAGGSRGFQGGSTFRLKDGSQTSALVMDNATGRWLAPDGTDMTDQIDIKINGSDAFGTQGQINAKTYDTLTSELRNGRTTLETLDRVLEIIPTVSTGLPGVARDAKAMYNILLGRGISAESIQAAIARGDIQGLIGGTREQVVGGGVMTEQDAVRVLEALGGNLDVLGSPEKMIERLSIIRAQGLASYNERYDRIVNHNTNYPNLGYITPTRYGSQEGDTNNTSSTSAPALDSSNAQEPIPQAAIESGVTPSDWQFMTPEERALFK
jgi:hypothetical protein